MNTTQWLERLRQTGTLPTVSENWDAAALLAEGTEALRTKFAQEIVTSGSGYWRQQEVVDTVQGQNEYRINPRAVVQGLQKLEVSANVAEEWRLMEIVTLGSDGLYESTRTGKPTHFSHYGDYVRVYPTPNTAYQLRFTFYLSPSTLVGAATYATVISKAGQVVLTSGDPSAFLNPSGGTLDVVNTTGCNEVALFDIAYTNINSLGGDLYEFTFPASVDLTRVTAGQVFRPVDTTDQIPLPRELQNSHAAYTAALVLLNTGDAAQGEKIAQKVSGDIKRIIDLAIPRDKAHPQKIKPRNSWLRRNAGNGRWR
jgi:hypothetical protein